MGAVSGLLGMAGGANGSGYAAPTAAEIQSPINNDQAQEAYKRSLQGLDQQQAFLQAIQAQNGIQNQSSVFNQLQNVANGQGPNPAQAMLANATGANTANQAALMAGQRGASANPALIARQAAMQGAANQQNAIGQGAQLQAQQSLNALSGMGNLATQQVGQQSQATAANTQAAQNQQQQLLNSIAQQNNARVGMQSNINTANAGLVSDTMGGQFDLISNLTGGGGSAAQLPKDKAPTGGGGAAMMLMGAEGGEIQDPTAPRSYVTHHMMGMPMKMMAQGGQVDALLSPGEQYLDKTDVKSVEKGANPLSVGEKIPGKPKVKGNSYANDTVPKKLEEGGIVIPNSVMQSKDPKKEAMKFVNAIMAKHGKSLPKKAK